VASLPYLQLILQLQSSTIRVVLDALLIGIRESENRFEPFVRAGISLFAIRFCSAGPKIEKVQTVKQKDLENIAHILEFSKNS